MNSGYLIDIGDKSHQDLQSLFKKRKLSANVSIDPFKTNFYQVLPPLIATESNPNFFEVRGFEQKDLHEKKATNVEKPTNVEKATNVEKPTNDENNPIDLCYSDPRHWRLGYRVLSHHSIDPLQHYNYAMEDYNYYRIILRHLEIVENVGYGYGKRLVPQDINMDNELYISRTKGCYTGQEVVNKLRNRLLFPRYKLVAESIADLDIKEVDIHQIIDDSGLKSNFNRDVFLALISYICNNCQMPQQYRMKLLHRI